MEWLGSSTERLSQDPQNNNGENSPTNGDSKALNYQSFPDTQVRLPRDVSNDTKYRGFSTSINHMFVDPDSERVDCCALACCGVFQNDRDRFLISGVAPPSCCKRFWVHLILPFWIFALAMFCALNVGDPILNQMLSTGLIIMLLGYFFIQSLKGMWKRREIRKDLLWSKYDKLMNGRYRRRSEDEDNSVDELNGGAPLYYMGQTARDIRNAHSLCGCYSSDDREPTYKIVNQTFCSRFFQCFTRACCGCLCGCYCQFCGICAVAQEGRQVEQLIPRKYRLVDYITMQPMLEYYPAIYNARNDENDEFTSSVSTSWRRLSNFSKWVIGIVVTVLVLLFTWSISVFHSHFGLRNFAVFCATLLQAFAVMKIVHWRHVKDISTDALIKYFVSGFCLSTTLAVFFELVVGLTMKLVMFVLMEIAGIDLVHSVGYSSGSSMISPGFADIGAMKEVDDSSTYRDYLNVYGRDHPIIYTIFLFINAFFLASTIEETCKYFGYRMIEHPDFLSRTEVEEAAQLEESQPQEGRSPQSFPQQDRTVESRGAAITVAMVATALGFACCENLVYIFIYGSSNFDVEVVILLARSVFPVHPIAAALQSIRVCERDLEKRPGMSLGWIIFPSVLFHGVYDFLLMWIDFLFSRHGNYVDDDDDKAMEPNDKSDWLSFVLSFVVMIGTLCYFFSVSARQRLRLRAMDEGSAVDQSRLI